METAALGIVLLVSLILFLRQQKAQTRRIIAQQDVPCDQLVPRHYKSFTVIETDLWKATNDLREARAWDAVRFGHHLHDFEILHNYLRGLRQDFQQGNRIFGRVISHSPEMEMFAQLEAERCRIEVSFYIWYALACFRLRTSGISIKELRHLTQIIATLAHRVRIFLNTLEHSGGLDAVDSILKNS
jgi:hypothetical protein